MNNQKDKPVLLVTLGFPGPGKTYFSRRFARDFNLAHLNSDFIRSELFINPEFRGLSTNTLLDRKLINLERKLLKATMLIRLDKQRSF